MGATTRMKTRRNLAITRASSYKHLVFGALRNRGMLRRLTRPIAWCVLVAGLLVTTLHLHGASARISFVSQYSLAQTYSAALRMLRVDMGLKVIERDAEAAYVLFEYKSTESAARVTSGSIQMVNQPSGVLVVVQLPQMPQYHEDVMGNALKRKLLHDYGDPLPRAPAPSPDQDAGPDSGAKQPDNSEDL